MFIYVQLNIILLKKIMLMIKPNLCATKSVAIATALTSVPEACLARFPTDMYQKKAININVFAEYIVF